MQTQIIPLGLDPINLVEFQKNNASGLTDDQSFPGLRSGAKIVQQTQQPIPVNLMRVLLKVSPSALDGFMKAAVFKGFQQVVQSVYLKSPHGVLVVSGDKHDQGQSPAVHGRQHVESIQPRHLHIEEYQIGRIPPNCGDCIRTVPTLANHLDVRFTSQQR